MKRYGRWLSAGCVLVVTVTGCRALPPPDEFLDSVLALLALQKEPVRIGVTNVRVDWLNPPWDPLQKDLTRTLDRPVHFVTPYPFQVRLQLAMGRLDFAIVSTGDFVTELAQGDWVEVLAIPVSASHGEQKRGVMLASAKSDIKSIRDLRGQRFAFGPRGDAILHLAAVAALEEGGVRLTELKRELLPIPGAFQHHISGLEAAKAAVYEEGTFACVVEEEEYNGWPDTGGTLLPLKIAKDQVRVIGYTPYMPEGVVLASKKTDPELVTEFRGYLVSGFKEESDLLSPMGWVGFVAADSERFEPAIRMGAVAMEAEPQLPEDEELAEPDEPSESSEESKSQEP